MVIEVTMRRNSIRLLRNSNNSMKVMSLLLTKCLIKPKTRQERRVLYTNEEASIKVDHKLSEQTLIAT